ncbi:bifunctional metallophosphatase/5'-nucleotidase [Paenibacillus pini]|uniref:5'-nucleotidase n=1 Tax=Paenibacillus pini JCM 16418 TaxID=1236976 RepID=W7Y626_9BACL|nr:bifunctional UDP-sugar hydrolase/5'-nucleotidase [Paenibacillus pini]GAF06295.1 5'-nucleotidase [Paenibacillus pini JCM 16418]
MRLDQPKSITILHTNDIHSHFEQVSSIAALITHEREQAKGSPLLVLDIGDHMDRAAVETEGTMGAVNVDILNLSGYDAVTIGNNEGLTLTPEVLSNTYAGLMAPIICSNIIEQTSGEPPCWMKPNAILERDGIRIGITGATAPYDTFYQLIGWSSLDPLESIRTQVEWLRPQVDIVIVLSHLGLTTDEGLAENVPGIDLILGGHTHHLLEEPLLIGQTTVCGAGKFGQYVGKVVMQQQSDGLFKVIKGECLQVNTDILDEQVSNALVTHRIRAEESLGDGVVITEQPISIRYDEESPFGNLLAQSVRQFTQTDLSIVNTGQLLGDLPSGEITTGLLHQLCPSPINSCVIFLKGHDIKATLEQSLLEEYQQKEIRGFGFRGEILGNIAIDGMEVLYDSSRIPYDRVVQITLNGTPLLMEQAYEVGTLDMFTFGIGYENISKGRDAAFFLPEFIRDLLRLELQRPGSLDQIQQKRWIEVR